MSVDYEQQVLDATADDLADWKVEFDPTRGTGAVTGPCPRCKHTTRASIRTTASVAQAMINSSIANVHSLTQLIDCACTDTDTHAKRPSGIGQGCGGEWLICIIGADAGFKVKPGDLDLLGAARAFYDASKNELITVRGIAENWVKGVAALLGLFSLAGIVFSKNAVSDLSLGYQEIFAVAAVAALAAAALGTYLAYKAAFGWPLQKKVVNDVGLQKFFNAQQNRARHAANALKWGVTSTFVSLAALGLAILVLWFGTPSSPPSPLVKITSRDGRTPCGSLLEKADDGSIQVRTAQGEVVKIDPTTITALTTSKKC